jgi:hypothetical protein
MEEDYLELAIQKLTESHGSVRDEDHKRSIQNEAVAIALIAIAQELRQLNNKLWQGVKVSQ